MNKQKEDETCNDVVKSYFENKNNNNEIETQLDKCIEEKASKISSFVIETRRELHKNPELMYNESKTSQIIQNILKSLNISFKTGYAKNIHTSTIPGEGGYGIIADIGTGEPPCVLLRTDMDALPLTEETPIIDFKSKNTGRMHACGHDGHMSMLLGAARVLKSMESQLNGTVRLMFQPAEEGGAGAKRMREEGILTLHPPVEMAFGMHVWPTLPSGVIGGKEGAQLASSCLFEINIVGVGGHAAMPHLTVDPIVAGSALITQLQTLVSRVLNPLDTGVLSITYFQAGDGAYNVIPKRATLRGTIRALSTQTMDHLKVKMEHMVHAVVIKAYGCSEAKVSYPMKDDYPPTINDSNVWKFAKDIASRISVEGCVRDVEATMGAEDFAFVAEAVPSAFLFLGSGGTFSKEEEKKQDCDGGKERLKTDYGLHHPKFALDEDVLSLGVRLHTNFAIKGLKKLSREMLS